MYFDHCARRLVDVPVATQQDMPPGSVPTHVVPLGPSGGGRCDPSFATPCIQATASAPVLPVAPLINAFASSRTTGSSKGSRRHRSSRRRRRHRRSSSSSSSDASMTGRAQSRSSASSSRFPRVQGLQVRHSVLEVILCPFGVGTKSLVQCLEVPSLAMAAGLIRSS